MAKIEVKLNETSFISILDSYSCLHLLNGDEECQKTRNLLLTHLLRSELMYVFYMGDVDMSMIPMADLYAEQTKRDDINVNWVTFGEAECADTTLEYFVKFASVLTGREQTNDIVGHLLSFWLTGFVAGHKHELLPVNLTTDGLKLKSYTADENLEMVDKLLREQGEQVLSKLTGMVQQECVRKDCLYDMMTDLYIYAKSIRVEPFNGEEEAEFYEDLLQEKLDALTEEDKELSNVELFNKLLKQMQETGVARGKEHYGRLDAIWTNFMQNWFRTFEPKMQNN